MRRCYKRPRTEVMRAVERIDSEDLAFRGHFTFAPIPTKWLRVVAVNSWGMRSGRSEGEVLTCLCKFVTRARGFDETRVPLSTRSTMTYSLSKNLIKSWPTLITYCKRSMYFSPINLAV